MCMCVSCSTTIFATSGGRRKERRDCHRLIPRGEKKKETRRRQKEQTHFRVSQNASRRRGEKSDSPFIIIMKTDERKDDDGIHVPLLTSLPLLLLSFLTGSTVSLPPFKSVRDTHSAETSLPGKKIADRRLNERRDADTRAANEVQGRARNDHRVYCLLTAVCWDPKARKRKKKGYLWMGKVVTRDANTDTPLRQQTTVFLVSEFSPCESAVKSNSGKQYRTPDPDFSLLMSFSTVK